jgi:hypothetical protein
MLVTDLYLGAFAMTRGAVVKRVLVSRASGGKATAIFELEGERLDELVEQFLLGDASVRIGTYLRELESLRDQVFGAVRRSENGTRNGNGNEDRRQEDDAHRQGRARCLEARR